MTTNATVTLLFADVAEADAPPDGHRPELQLLRDAVAAHGGTEVKNIGQGLMVVFQSAVDAVSCGVAMLQAVDRHNRRSGARTFDIRVGANVGEPTREGDDYFGLPVVLAKRLCDSAAPGQMIVSDVVRVLVSSRAAQRFRPLEPRDLKGVGLTVVYEVAWQAARPAALPLPPALVPPADACFVGREREVERLRAAWKDATLGNRRAVLTGGEPGVGKTRLAAELANQIGVASQADDVPDGIVLYGRCDEDLGVPYQPFAEALRAAVAACTDDELQRRVGPSGATLVRLVPELADRLPDLATVERGEAEAERYLLFEAVAEFLAAASEDVPILLVLDDLHWAAKPTLMLLRHVLRATVPMSVLLIGTFRDTEIDRAPLLAETLADLRRDADVDRISLSGLDRASVAAFVVAATGSDDIDGQIDELAEAVHAGTDGNPFFVGELLRHLQESEGRLGEVGLPQGITDVVLSRLGRLSSLAHRALSVASVIGQRFELAVLERVLADSADDAGGGTGADALLDALDEAVRAHVVVELAIAGQYSFAHALIREVLVDDLSAARRARIHWQITTAIESLGESNRAEQLAFHSAEAGAIGDIARAADYAVVASERALERLAYEEAATIAERGLRVLGDRGDADSRRRAALRLAISEARNFTGEVAAMKQSALDAAADARNAGWPQGVARAAVLYGRWVAVSAVDPQARALMDEALALLPQDDLVNRARVSATLANYLTTGESRGADVVDLAEQSLALAREAGDRDSLAWSLYLTAVALSATGDIDARKALADELVGLTKDRDDARGVLDGRVVRAALRLELGDLAGFEEDIAELERLGERMHWWAAVYWGGVFRLVLMVMAGRFDEADAAATAQLEPSSQDVNALNAFAAQLYSIRREQGRLGEITEIMEGAVAESPGLIAFRAGLAQAHAESGRVDEARRELWALAAEDFALVPRDQAYVVTLALLAEVVALVGDAELARPLEARLAAHGGRLAIGGSGVVCFGAVDRYRAILLAVAGDHDAAASLFEAAVELETSVASPPAVARTQYWWAVMLVTVLPADRRAALLDAAGDTADKLGMALLSAKVREARAGTG
jgi:tetratricopeptide (TPR) repeat protein